MKRLISFFLFVVSILPVYSLEWNTSTYSMSDDESCCGWKLPWDVYHTWERKSPLEAHTIFRVYQPQTGMVAFVNFNRFNKEPIYNSIWDVFDEYENILKEQDKKRYAKGELISNRETFATFFNGECAICSYYISRKREQGSSTKTHSLSYYMINKIGLYIIAVKCSDSSYVKYGKAYMEGILHGFYI